MLRTIAPLIIAFAMLGCTTLRPLDVSDPVSVKVSLDPGNHVAIVTTQQQTLELQLTLIAEDAIYGLDSSGATWQVPYDAIVHLEVRRFSHAKTNGLLAGTSVATLLFVVFVLCC